MQQQNKQYLCTYLSPGLVPEFLILSLLLNASPFFIDPPSLGTGSSVSLRRTAELGKRTVCARYLSVGILRFGIALTTCATPLALVFEVDVSTLPVVTKELGTPFVGVPFTNE